MWFVTKKHIHKTTISARNKGCQHPETSFVFPSIINCFLLTKVTTFQNFMVISFLLFFVVLSLNSVVRFFNIHVFHTVTDSNEGEEDQEELELEEGNGMYFCSC